MLLTMESFDTIVVGLGAMGSASVYQLAKRHNRVLGIDQFSVPHDYGSTHGESRIIRQAIGEGERYVPLVLRSYELWRALEKETGQTLLTTTGGLILEPKKSAVLAHGRHNFLAQTIGCAKKFNIRHTILETKEIRKRFPQFVLTDELGYYEYETGYLRPELCVQAQLQLAKNYGATIRLNEKVTSIAPHGSSAITVVTDRSTYTAEKLVLSAGAWLAGFLPAEYGEIFKVYRQVMYWFRIKEGAQGTFARGRFPIFIWIFEKGGDFAFYGFPTFDGVTLKIAGEQYSESTSAQSVERTISKEEIGLAYSSYVRDRFHGLTAVCERAATCLYTTTPDSHFVIDFYPGNDRIVIASPCSGHGFKHSAAIGEVVCELVSLGKSKIAIDGFRIDRFVNRRVTPST
jgi:sarcosine oxidase